MTKIAVAGLGYVGLSNAVLLAQHNQVTALDITPERVAMVNDRKSPIEDREIAEYLASHKLDLTATLDPEIAFRDAEFVVVSTPTNYDARSNRFDTSTVEHVLAEIHRINPDAVAMIRVRKRTRYAFDMPGRMAEADGLHHDRDIVFGRNQRPDDSEWRVDDEVRPPVSGKLHQMVCHFFAEE